MKRPGFLRRRTPLRSTVRLHRRPRPAADRVEPAEALYVFARDSWRCIATRFDPAHRCQGRLTIEHVPEDGKNAFGMRAPSDRWHMVAACLGANSPEGWCSTHREDERAWLGAIETTPRPTEEGINGATTA